MIARHDSRGGGPSLLEFYIEKNTSTPIVNQIEEQIKIAVMMGILRSGDTLPSIRDIEKQTGINRNQIHKAYLALRRSGLLVLIRGKGSIITTVAISPRAISENCRKMSKEFISKVHQSGISPTAFARFFSRYAQESEHGDPLIYYIDHHEEIALQTAAEISQLWQVPVGALPIQKLRTAMAKGKKAKRILVNHLLCDTVRSLIPDQKSAVIPIEIQYSQQTIKQLNQIAANSSVLLILLPQSSQRVQFMISQLQKLMRSPGVRISTVSNEGVSSFKELLEQHQHDYILVGPGARGKVPKELRQNSRLVLLNVQIDLESLEAARIRAGAII